MEFRALAGFHLAGRRARGRRRAAGVGGFQLFHLALGLQLSSPSFHEFVDLLPRFGSRRRDSLVGRISEADHVTTIPPQILNVVWTIFDVNVRSNLSLVSHKAEIPKGDVVVI